MPVQHHLIKQHHVSNIILIGHHPTPRNLFVGSFVRGEREEEEEDNDNNEEEEEEEEDNDNNEEEEDDNDNNEGCPQFCEMDTYQISHRCPILVLFWTSMRCSS